MENASHSISVPVYTTLYLKPLRRLLDQTATAGKFQLLKHQLLDSLSLNIYRFLIGKPVLIPSGLRIVHSAIIVFQLRNQLLVLKIPGANCMLSTIGRHWKAVKNISVLTSFCIQSTYLINCNIILLIVVWPPLKFFLLMVFTALKMRNTVLQSLLTVCIKQF